MPLGLSHSSQLQTAKRSGVPLAAGRLPTPSSLGVRTWAVLREHQRAGFARVRAVIRDEEDLMQIPDRLEWYEAKFCAEDMPEWNAARLLRSRDLAPGVREVVLEAEISRERIPLKAAYKHAGQCASVRVNGGLEVQVPVSSPPFPQALNSEPLFKIRGDLFAGDSKLPVEAISVKAELSLVVSKESAPDLYEATEDEAIELGPFKGTGLDLRGSKLLAVYRYPTLVLFVEGPAGIATARALLLSGHDVTGLSAPFRDCVRVYYRAPNEMSLCYRDELDAWKEAGAGVVTGTSSFQDMFDDDDTFAYTPEYTGAIILTGGNEEAEAAAREACREAEIIEVMSDKSEAAPVTYLNSVPNSFIRWAEEAATRRNAAAAAAAAASGDASGNANGNGTANGNGNGRPSRK